MAKRILIVDDDVIGLKQLKAFLIDKDFEVESANDGDVALEIIKSFSPDIVLLDVEMPRMNGYFFMGEFRKIEGCQDVPVIIITSHENMKRAFSGKGVKDYIIKPVEFNHLLELLNKYV